MTKVLFVNPSQENIIEAQRGWSLGISDVGYYQPLGILYVATYLKENNPDVTVKAIDAASPDMPYPELEKRTRAFYPDVLGIATYTFTFIDTLKVAHIAKKINPSVHINVGGHHLTYFPKETLQHEVIDSIIIGEGEQRFYELVKYLQSGEEIENIDGVFTRRNIDRIDSYKQTFIKDISKLNFPDRALLEDFNYYNHLTIEKKMTTIVSSRGCPFDCKFCILGKQPYRKRTSKNLVDEIEYLMKQGYTDFFFAEDTFNINMKKVSDFHDELKRRNLKISWCCKARVSGTNYEMLKKMAETGCYLINFGVETGTDAGLKYLNKGLTVKEIREVFDWCKRLKIQTMAYFMIGQPFEKTEEDVKKSVDFLISLEPDFCNINSFIPLPSTPFFEEGVKKGFLSYESWRNMVLTGAKFEPHLWEEFFANEELQDIRSKAIKKFYMRPSYILKQLKQVSSWRQLLYKARVASHMLFDGLYKKSKIN